ncbi:hypothetical protein [Nonomuraea sp. JJY05]|uniref:hypothetical protein n=1 Tax=Nonomuraea sp. JJY05 TaxID=3350255 RepID=UPI00373F7CAC
MASRYETLGGLMPSYGIYSAETIFVPANLLQSPDPGFLLAEINVFLQPPSAEQGWDVQLQFVHESAELSPEILPEPGVTVGKMMFHISHLAAVLAMLAQPNCAVEVWGGQARLVSRIQKG